MKFEQNVPNPNNNNNNNNNNKVGTITSSKLSSLTVKNYATAIRD